MQPPSFRRLLVVSTLGLAGCAAGSGDDAPPTGSVASSTSASSSSSGGGATSTSTSSGGGQGGGGAGQGGGASQGGGGASTGAGGDGGAGGASSTTTSSTTTSSSSTTSGGGGAGGCAPYTHTITIDGTNDFAATDEAFATTSTGYTGYVAWDSSFVYFAMKGPDVADTSGTRWLLAYLGTPTAVATTMAGQLYGGGVLSPGLAFPASWHFRRKFGGDEYQSLMTFAGSNWNDGTLPTGSAVARSGDFVEVRLPLSHFGSPTTLRLHLSMINEQNGGQYTFAGVPQSSFTDAIDPDYTKYFELELDGCDTPTMYTPL
jgi:hypothetical protein